MLMSLPTCRTSVPHIWKLHWLSESGDLGTCLLDSSCKIWGENLYIQVLFLDSDNLEWATGRWSWMCPLASLVSWEDHNQFLDVH